MGEGVLWSEAVKSNRAFQLAREFGLGDIFGTIHCHSWQHGVRRGDSRISGAFHTTHLEGVRPWKYYIHGVAESTCTRRAYALASASKRQALWKSTSGASIRLRLSCGTSPYGCMQNKGARVRWRRPGCIGSPSG